MAKLATWAFAGLILVTPLIVDLTTGQICPTEWSYRHNNRTCPPKAICGEKFNLTETLPGDNTCTYTKIRFNCMCGRQECPVFDNSYRMYASPTNELYTCEHSCDHPLCSEHAEGSRHGQISIVRVYIAPEFYNYTYQRMECRCPRHKTPSHGNGPSHYSVMAKDDLQINGQQNYFCQNSNSERSAVDPCSGWND
ncbi:hypothetical protein Btru_035297 [Bulinus truncatus]|nr:hypothetical protein Btru_035297 [Bulinus truncatus]